MAYQDSWAVGNAANRLVGTEDSRRAIGALLVPGSTPVGIQIPASGLRPGAGDPGKVAATGTPGPNVTVNALSAFLSLAARPGPYIATMDATLTVDVLGANPADPSNQRNDLIVAQQNDADYGDANRNFQVVRITGTPSGSPVDPSVSGSQNYITLARIRVTAGATTITNAMIDDLRPPWIVALGGVKPVRNVTERAALPLADGQVIYRLDRDWTEICDGTAWRVQGVAVCSSTADRDSAITDPYNGQFAVTTDTGTVWQRQSGAWIAGGPVAEMYQSSTQNITNNSWTAITFDAETHDTHNGHSTSTTNTRWTCPTGWDGYYSVSGTTYFASGTAGVRVAAIAKNGTRVRGSVGRDQPVQDGFGNAVNTGPHVVQLAAGDYVELHAIHTQGSTVATFAGDPETSSMTVAFLRRT